MHIPASTYRVQLHQDFTFGHLEKIVDYLKALGITTIYAAPILKATPSSMHGYDVTDPHTLNPEIGSLREFRSLAAKLKRNNMSWIQDIVPNHMAFHTSNFRLMDVLERGPASPYRHYFDIDWNHPSPSLNGKVQVPFLGDEREACVERQEIQVAFSEQGFTIRYFDTHYPLSLSAFALLFAEVQHPPFPWNDFSNLGNDSRDYKDWNKDKAYYLSSVANNETQHFAILRHLEDFNRDKKRMLALLDTLYYQLTYWKQTEQEINYRRFFTVNELICLRMEEESVFDEYHKFLHTLYQEKLIQGLRIDHIDGLKDPTRYCLRLREYFGDDCYIIAEKILEAKEDIPQHWPLQGTSGYEFLAYVNQLMTNRSGAKDMIAFYREMVPQLPPYKALVVQNKTLILEKYMAGEWSNLLRLLLQNGLGGNVDHERLKQALGAFMIALPVYRIYPDSFPLRGHDRSVLHQAFQYAAVLAPSCKTALDHLFHVFTNPAPDLGQRSLCVLQRLMQFTGPLTAKGVEDTTFYVYNALISHDEVGDSPATLGMSVASFHRAMATRQSDTPHALNATATHDTKRGEDARLRLNALCEFTGEWKKLVTEWFAMNRKFHVRMSNGKMAPTQNDEYYIYQAIVGGFPEDRNITEEWIGRLLAYQVKAVREAKLNSDWAGPNVEYENACASFIRSVLAPGGEFLTGLEPFLEKVITLAAHYALGQTLIKITAPGIPDIYQGCELWDLSFVDPDNRRPVDYGKRREMLDRLQQKEQEGQAVLFSFLEDLRPEGVEKLFVTRAVLHIRQQHPLLFQQGAYLPLQVTGKDTVAVVYARVLNDRWIIVVIPVGIPAGNEDAGIVLPENAPKLWRNVFTGDIIPSTERLSFSQCLGRFAVALVVSVR